VAAAGKVGEAFIDVVGKYDKFIKETEKKINAVFKSVSGTVEFDALEDEARKAGDTMGREYTEAFEQSISRDRSRSRRLARENGRSFLSNFFRGTEEEERRRGNFVTRLFGNVGTKAAAGFTAAFSALGSLFGGAGAAGGAGQGLFGGLASSLDLSKILPVLGPILKFGAILFLGPHIISTVFAIGSAIYFLAGNLLLLPGALAAVAIPMGVLAIAFSGFGEAVTALASGDIEKINEALKDLPPSMRRVARETAATLVPAFKEIRSGIQEQFFKPLRGEAQQLVQSLGPIFAGGLGRIAGSLGRLFKGLLDSLESPRGQQFFANLFSSVDRIVNQFGPKLLSIFGSFGKIFEASLPFVEMLFRLIGNGIDRFGAWIDEQVASGALEEFLLSALETGKDFIGVIEQLLELFGALFEDTEEGGQTFLKDITEALKLLTDFFKSEEGKLAIRLMIRLAKDFGRALVFAADVLIRIIRLAKATADAIEAAFNWMIRLIAKAVGITGIGGAVGRAVGGGSGSSFAVGGIVTQPTRALIGEAGPEAVIPLSKPRRAMELMQDSGLVSLVAGMNQGATTVLVYLGTQQITDILDVRVDKGLQRSAKRLSDGVRLD
jgi:hypothetical protein